MGLETGNFIDALNVANPGNLDEKARGDDHLRLIKSVLKNSFPNLASALNSPNVMAASGGVGASDNYKVIVATAAITITLADVAGLGSAWRILVYAGGNSVTVETTGTNTINGAESITLAPGGIADIISLGDSFLAILPSFSSIVAPGGTLTGFLSLHANPTSPMHAATKAYVDTRVGTRFVSSAAPSGGVDGDVWYQVAP